MITKEQTIVGTKVLVPLVKTAGTSFAQFDAEMKGCRLEWNSKKGELYYKRYGEMKTYELPYLVIDHIGTFADDETVLSVILRRDDSVAWLGNDSFTNEDLELYG